MSDYLKRLAMRLVNPPAVIRPRMASRFESPGPSTPGDAEFAATGEAESVTFDAGPPSVRGRSAETPRALRPESPGETATALPQSRIRAFSRPIESARVTGRAAIEPSPQPRVASPALLPEASPTVQSAIEVSTQPTATRSSEEQAPASRSIPPAIEMPAVLASPAPSPSAAAVPSKRVETVERRDAPLLAPTLSLAVANAMRRHDVPASSSETPPTVVQVTIGTVEVRAPAPPSRPQPAASRPSLGPRLSLQDYLQRRGTERRS